jgi:hypothetical protein
MERGARRKAKAPNVPGVRRNLGLNEDDVEHLPSEQVSGFRFRKRLEHALF